MNKKHYFILILNKIKDFILSSTHIYFVFVNQKNFAYLYSNLNKFKILLKSTFGATINVISYFNTINSCDICLNFFVRVVSEKPN